MTAVPHFKLSLLGSLQLGRTAGDPVTPRRKTRALLAYLAATNRPYTRRSLVPSSSGS